jgi:glutamyl-tRNA reductase
VSVRERYAVAPDALIGVVEKLALSAAFREVALISTCNRTEIVAVARNFSDALEEIHGVFQNSIGDGSAEASQFYELHDRDVVRHVFRVASGLDSMVLGEAQVLGQLKDAYRASVTARSVGPLLNRMFQRAFRTAKRVRAETGLGAATVSVARVGVDCAREIFESFEDKRLMLLGAGRMAESALLALRDAGARNVVIVNRSMSSARALAERVEGRAAPLDALAEELAGADVVVASARVERPLISLDQLERARAGHAGRPLLVIDLAVPRNVDPAARALEGVHLYDLDDLEALAEQGRCRRRAAVDPAEAIVLEELDRFEHWRAGLSAVPAIRELLDQSGALAREEVNRALARLPDATPELQEALERVADRILGKLLHSSLEHLRAEAQRADGPYYADAVREIFGLQGGAEGG